MAENVSSHFTAGKYRKTLSGSLPFPHAEQTFVFKITHCKVASREVEINKNVMFTSENYLMKSLGVYKWRNVLKVKVFFEIYKHI